MLYRPNSEFSRSVETFIRDFQYQHGDIATHLEVIDIDSREGINKAGVYDDFAYPALLVIADDGQLVKDWQQSLPLLDELAGYLNR